MSTSLTEMTPAAFCLSISAFCAWAGVSRSFTYAEIAAGRLRARKAGRKTIILIVDAEEWANSRPAIEPKGSIDKKAA